MIYQKILKLLVLLTIWKKLEIFLSPIFKNNKSKKNLGIVKFSIIKLNSKTNLIALGGINDGNFKKLKPLELNGFACISWAKKNGLSNLRPF